MLLTGQHSFYSAVACAFALLRLAIIVPLVCLKGL